MLNHQFIPTAQHLATAFGRQATPRPKGLLRRVDGVPNLALATARQLGQHRLIHRITQRVMTVRRLGQPLSSDVGTGTPQRGILK
ncbi:hypothetical protein D9M69_408660 [compost metagenome]